MNDSSRNAGELVLGDHHGVDDLVGCQHLPELLPVDSSPEVAAVFEQQIAGAFINRLVLFWGFSILAVSDRADHTAYGGHDVKQVKDDTGPVGSFLTVLM